MTSKSIKFSGKIDWVDLSAKYDGLRTFEPVSGFFIDEGKKPYDKDDLILNKIWDVLHKNLGKDIKITLEM